MTLIDKTSENNFPPLKSLGTFMGQKQIIKEVYDFLFLWNPNGTLAMNHPPTQILTVLGF